MSDKVKVLNTANGQVQLVRPIYVDNPKYPTLVQVKPETKGNLRELWREKTPDEYKELHSEKVVSTESVEPESEQEKD